VGPDPDTTTLLQRHIPVLRYDSQEPYFADLAAEWTDNPGNQLQDPSRAVIAAASPTGGQPKLSLSFLGPQSYADGHAVSRNDRIADPGHDYVAQARLLHAQSQYANFVHGHAATGTDGRVWLAYWFFYFYNDYNLIGPLVKAGLHEGDWEMIQLRLDPTGQVPDLAVYAQHTHAAQRPWGQVEKVGDQPVVYPARGSHASYFASGVHWTGAWFDFADGNRPAPALNLHVISDASGQDGWAVWPGMWGGTQPPADDINPMDDSSPRGPGGHDQYRNPDKLLQTAVAQEAVAAPPPASAAPPPAPAVTAAAVADGLHIAYDTHVANPSGLVVAIGDARDRRPPEIHRIPINTTTGTAVIPGAGGDGQTIHVSTATQDLSGSPATQVVATRG
jgi:hypothetical protein